MNVHDFLHKSQMNGFAPLRKIFFQVFLIIYRERGYWDVKNPSARPKYPALQTPRRNSLSNSSTFG